MNTNAYLNHADHGQSQYTYGYPEGDFLQVPEMGHNLQAMDSRYSLQDYNYGQHFEHQKGYKSSHLNSYQTPHPSTTVPQISAVKTEFHGGYTSQLQQGEAYYDPRHYMNSNQPVSPYAGHSISDGTVSSTVSSPRTPSGNGLQSVFDDPCADDVFGNTESIVPDQQLIEMSARDLNKLMKDYSAETVSKLKKKRRTLKNRGYALNSRLKRVHQKNHLEDERDELKTKVQQLTSEVSALQKELEQYKERCTSFEKLLKAKSDQTFS